MHLTLAPGVYIVAGSTITSDNDCTTLLVCSLEEPPSCALVGCGGGTSLHAITRNILELQLSLRNLRYVVIPTVLECLCRGCKLLKDALPWLHIVAPPSLARSVRAGACGEPCPVTVESTSISIGETKIVAKALGRRAFTILIERASKSLSLILIPKIFDDVNDIDVLAEGDNRIICLLEEPVCWRVA